MEVRDVLQEGSFAGVAAALQAEVTTAEDGSRMGVSPVIWNSWETTGVNLDLGLANEQVFNQGATNRVSNAAVNRLLAGQDIGRNQIIDSSDQINNNLTVSGTTSLVQNRIGSQNTVIESIDTESLGDRIVRREIINFARSRNVQYTATSLKPFTRVYSFFDGSDINAFTFNKLVEIEMTTGTFQVGETVQGRMNDDGVELLSLASTPRIDFRVATPNHKYGPYN